MSVTAFQQLRDSPTQELRDLLQSIRVFHHLRDMGMFSGKYGSADACRRNASIVECRNKLGLTRKELSLLANIHYNKDEHPLAPRIKLLA